MRCAQRAGDPTPNWAIAGWTAAWPTRRRPYARRAPPQGKHRPTRSRVSFQKIAKDFLGLASPIPPRLRRLSKISKGGGMTRNGTFMVAAETRAVWGCVTRTFTSTIVCLPNTRPVQVWLWRAMACPGQHHSRSSRSAAQAQICEAATRRDRAGRLLLLRTQPTAAHGDPRGMHLREPSQQHILR